MSSNEDSFWNDSDTSDSSDEGTQKEDHPLEISSNEDCPEEKHNDSPTIDLVKKNIITDNMKNQKIIIFDKKINTLTNEIILLKDKVVSNGTKKTIVEKVKLDWVNRGKIATIFKWFSILILLTLTISSIIGYFFDLQIAKSIYRKTYYIYFDIFYKFYISCFFYLFVSIFFYHYKVN